MHRMGTSWNVAQNTSHAQDLMMNENYGYERSFHSNVETFVVWSLLLLSSPPCCHWCVRRTFARFGHLAGLTFTVCSHTDDVQEFVQRRLQVYDF